MVHRFALENVFKRTSERFAKITFDGFANLNFSDLLVQSKPSGSIFGVGPAGGEGSGGAGCWCTGLC